MTQVDQNDTDKGPAAIALLDSLASRFKQLVPELDDGSDMGTRLRDLISSATGRVFAELADRPATDAEQATINEML